MHETPMFSFLSSPVMSPLLESELHASSKRSSFFCTPPPPQIFSTLGVQIGFGAFAMFAGGESARVKEACVCGRQEAKEAEPEEHIWWREIDLCSLSLSGSHTQ